ncbi:hypothetical protein GCM10007391_20870 [Alteromonas halophila]|uniref:Uncharacterized protein n=1 Tax=Alteromonas halophila TaxID=516698 RepID=A0A918JMX2_9ALTE|nr:hypothetical protein GCM10007391_20870 [Alteromonas halophila]
MFEAIPMFLVSSLILFSLTATQAPLAQRISLLLIDGLYLLSSERWKVDTSGTPQHLAAKPA